MNTKLLPDKEELLENAGRYRRLVEKLNYLTVTRPDITSGVSVLSQFLQEIDHRLCLSDRISTTGYCVFLEWNPVSWKRKKQSVVSQSSAESEYMTMANMILELIWIRDLLTEIGFPSECPWDYMATTRRQYTLLKWCVSWENQTHWRWLSYSS